MTDFAIHTEASAPAEARPLLTECRNRFGAVPNLHGAMAESPALLEGYLRLSELFEHSSLSPADQAVVMLTVSRFHACEYCMAAHSAFADMQDIPRVITDAIREDRRIPAARFEALRRLTEQLVARRGWPDPQVLDSFLAAGYGQRQLLEVILGIGLKTLSNYTNQVAGTPLDAMMAQRAWQPPGPGAEAECACNMRARLQVSSSASSSVSSWA